jgi:flagellar biosynthetic protein FliO
MKKEAENYTWVIARITLYLAIVIAIILAVAWIVRKMGIGNSSRIGGGGSMDILESLQFGQNRNAILVRVMDTVYLLGQTPTSIVLLEKIEGQKAIDLIASSKGGGGSVMQFKDVFNNFMGKTKKQI